MRASEIFELQAASLSEVTFPRLLHAISSSGRTMVVELSSKAIVKKIIFEHGGPVDCRSNLAHETLSRFMVRQGLITREQESRLLADAAARKLLFGEMAREAGLVSSADLFKILQQNLAKKLLDLFTWEDGEVRIRANVPVVESPLQVKVPQLILTGCASFVPMREVELGIERLEGQKLGLHPAPAVDVGELHLSVAQRQLVESLRRPRGLAEITEAAGTSFEDTARFVYALLVMEVLLPETELEPIAPVEPFDLPAMGPTVEVAAELGAETAAAPEPPSEDREPPPSEKRDSASIANEVMSTYLRHRRVDAFGLLGVTEDTPKQLVDQRFLEYCRRFAPWSFSSTELESLADKAEELFMAGVVAYASIVDPARPAAAESGRRADRLEITLRAADELEIESELLDPEEQFEKGRSLMEVQSYAQALKHLELASTYDPQNSLYRAEAAYCWYLSSAGTGGTLALQRLDEAIRIDPSCGIAVFYRGDIQREMGRWDAAEECLRRSIKMLAPDRRPIEALRSLARERREAETETETKE